MSFESVGPVVMTGKSQVTSSLGANDPEVGVRKTFGGNEYVWSYNDGNSDINPGFAAVLQSGATGMSVTVSSVTSADLVVGVGQSATLTTGLYGWLQTRGFAQVEMGGTSGTVAAGGLIEAGANGVFVPVSNITSVGEAVGKALAAIVSSASGSAYISVF